MKMEIAKILRSPSVISLLGRAQRAGLTVAELVERLQTGTSSFEELGLQVTSKTGQGEKARRRRAQPRAR